MGKAQAIAALAVMLALAGVAGYLVGSGVSAGRAVDELADIEAGLIQAQGRIEELTVANRELADRQQRAQSIVARTAGTLVEAGATARRIDDLIDRIIGTVEDLERAYNLLGGEHPAE